jgi:hypothetical protein
MLSSMSVWQCDSVTESLNRQVTYGVSHELSHNPYTPVQKRIGRSAYMALMFLQNAPASFASSLVIHLFPFLSFDDLYGQLT